MLVLSKQVSSKDEHPCLDAIVATDRLVAVIDQSTAKSEHEVDLLKPLVDQLRSLSGRDRFTAVELIERLSRAARSVDSAAGRRACATVVVVDPGARQVIRVGDGHVVIDGHIHPGHNPVDEVLGRMRSLLFALEPTRTGGIEDGVDRAREAIIPYLRAASSRFRNDATSAFGFGAVDGTPVPKKFIEVFPLPRGRCQVSIMTDGYPFPTQSLEECEFLLDRLIRGDPSMTSINATKGVMPTAASFDDRAFVGVELPEETG